MPNRGNAAEKEAAVASASPNKYPPIKAGLHRDIDKLALDDLIRSIPDAQLRFAIAREVAKLKANKKFGLVFEEHAPEVVQLPNFPVQVGATVVKRGDRKNEIFRVTGSAGGSKFQITGEAGEGEETVSAKELVVIKKFGEPIYPTLTSIDRVTRGHDKPYHTIINADNFHALQLLLYCYEGQVDVIYIDPPFNTGARDWKYNNDYVDKNDQYRHSKWLSMMKRRLTLAKRLLKNDGVLICAIDDYEFAHLRVLFEQLFKEYTIETVVVNHHPQGGGGDNISRTHEYALFCVPKATNLLGTLVEFEEDHWSLQRSGSSWKNFRTGFPNQFYAIHYDPLRNEVVDIGPSLNKNDPYPIEPTPEGLIRIYPIDRQGRDRIWRYVPKTMRDKISKGLVVANRNRSGKVTLKLRVNRLGKFSPIFSNWTHARYNAGTHGTSILNSIFGTNDKFPYPKSIYTVMDCVAAVCRTRENALVLDFFSGSGTTFQAVALLNEADCTNHRCILVTNNEVLEKQAKHLIRAGYFPGSPEFEKHGICESVTWPRCKYVVKGKRDDGTELSGAYLNGRAMKEGFEENIEYFKLDFLDPHEVAYGEKFEAILPILWLMAGAEGERDKAARGYEKWFIPENSPFAVLIKEDHFAEFKRKIKQRRDITHVFLVTDSEEAFREMIAELPSSLKTKMLYKSYLDNFRINTGENL